ncbi:MAG: tetratricopeptide repeat protein [Elusimicrobia bacterium]|nr:tetratricopeptide repeat protein [Elusimicrobiota bacterium]
MFDDFSFRKLFFVLAVIGGGIWYVNNKVSLDDAFRWSLAVKEHDSRARAIYYVGMVSYMKDDNAKAAEVFSRLLADHPTCQYAPKTLVRLGGVYRQMNQWGEARTAYERYMEEFPNGPDISIVQNNYEYVKFR